MPASDLDHFLRWDGLDDDASHSGISSSSGSSLNDRQRAGPSSEQDLILMWSIETPLLLLCSIAMAIVFLGIITNPTLCKNPFYKYILFLCVPNFIYSLFYSITSLLNALNGAYTSWGMCQSQVFYWHFHLAANAWLLAILACHVHSLLTSSRISRRYRPPTNRQVYGTSLVCYGIAFLAASLPMFNETHGMSLRIPQPGIRAGYTCAVSVVTRSETLFWWLVLVPLTFGLPSVYAMWVVYEIVVRSKLLPPRGRRRKLSLYFFRIGAVFLVWWMPTIAVLYIFRGMASPWVTWSIGLFSHTQGLVSALCMAFGTADIRNVVLRFIGIQISSSVRDKVVSSALAPSSSQQQQQQERQTTRRDDAVAPESAMDTPGLPFQSSDFQFHDEDSPNRNVLDELIQWEANLEAQRRRRRRGAPTAISITVPSGEDDDDEDDNGDVDGSESSLDELKQQLDSTWLAKMDRPT